MNCWRRASTARLPKKKLPVSDNDPAIDAILETIRTQQVAEPEASFLWLADEHPVDPSKLDSLAKGSLLFISNRWDQYLLAQSLKIPAQFSDFDIPEELSPQGIFIRVPKERALMHYQINQSFLSLPMGGRLWLAGYKNEGIKTHIDRAARLFGSKPAISKGKNQLSVACLEKHKEQGQLLDDNQYSTLRHIETGQTKFWSKPGIYGWNKVDPGSKLLTETLSGHTDAKKGIRVLDIGCGYGYLSIWATQLQPAKLTATDNCLGALEAAQKNLETTDNCTVLASNAGDRLEGQYDLILCNPPFHQGFTTTPDLHKRFLSNTQRLLAPEGSAWFVVNQFLNLEKIASLNNLSAREVARLDGFRVLRLRNPENA